MIADALRSVPPPRLVREQAFEQVRNAIISGQIVPGTRLIERELCEALGISRASVREMIRRLEAERLIAVEPRKGPTVMALTRKDAAEIYEIRAMLEALLIERFTEIASDEDIAGLSRIFEDVKAAAAKGAVSDIVALMLRFNDHLVSVVRHEVARDLLSQLNARINFLRVKAMAKPGRISTSIGEISAIMDAVRQRNGARAARLIKASVLQARDAALEQLSGPAPGRRSRRETKQAGSGETAPATEL
jgi:DNA-binding GntR family transcriptional regulator